MKGFIPSRGESWAYSLPWLGVSLVPMDLPLPTLGLDCRMLDIGFNL